MKVRISAPALRIVAPHISEDPSRPILGGVCVEPSGVIVATDGKTLCAHQSGATVADSESGCIVPVIVRFRRIREALARKVETVEVDTNGRGAADLVARLEDARGVLIGTTLVDMVDGPYPLWRGVVPSVDRDPVAIPAIAINPDLIGRFSTFPGGTTGGAAHFRFTGQESAILVTHPQRTDIIGLCMPYKYVANTADVTSFAWAAK